MNSNGGLEVGYTYDAWGNVQVSGSNVGLHNNNPFRYRGYFFDTETGLYYLKNRYYDPATGRFISPDDLSYLNPDTINGLNLYSYCGNNPVMNIDPNGNAWWDFIAVSAITVLAVAGGVALSILGGPVGSVFAGVCFGLATGMIDNTIEQVKANGFENVNVGEALQASVPNMVLGAFGGAVSYGVGVLGGFLSKTIGNAIAGFSRFGSSLMNSSTILSTGVKVGNIVGAYFGEYAGNRLFFNRYGLNNDDYKENLLQEVLGWIAGFVKKA